MSPLFIRLTLQRYAEMQRVITNPICKSSMKESRKIKLGISK